MANLPSQLLPGTILGRYEITSRLASGGMAEVWLAQATGVSGFRKQVVIKTILPSLVENPEFTKMFIQEALVASGLNHPNIVQIFDLGECDGHYFIAMEHVPGKTLRQIVKAHRSRQNILPQWFVLQVLSAACQGLHYAHELRDEGGRFLGLVHRDISPENIMVSYNGMVKVLDFGVAKADTGTGAVRTGSIKGKHAYMAPEAFEGKVDRRTDIFALGVMLYELLTGVRPYQGKNVFDIMWQVIQTVPPPPSHICEQVPWELERIVLDALERDLSARIADASLLQRRIDEFIVKWGGSRSPHEMGEFVRDLFKEDYEVHSSRPMMLSKGVAPPIEPAVLAPSTAKSPAEDLGTAKTSSYRAKDSSSKQGNEKDSERERRSDTGFGRRSDTGFGRRSDTLQESVGDSGPDRRSDPGSDPDRSSGKRNSWAEAARSAAMKHKNLEDSAGAKSVDTPVVSRAQPVDSDRRGDTDEATLHFERGLQLTRKGLHEEALREWELAMHLDPRNRSYEVNVRKLKKKLAGEG